MNKTQQDTLICLNKIHKTETLKQINNTNQEIEVFSSIQQDTNQEYNILFSDSIVENIYDSLSIQSLDNFENIHLNDEKIYKEIDYYLDSFEAEKDEQVHTSLSALSKCLDIIQSIKNDVKKKDLFITLENKASILIQKYKQKIQRERNENREKDNKEKEFQHQKNINMSLTELNYAQQKRLIIYKEYQNPSKQEYLYLSNSYITDCIEEINEQIFNPHAIIDSLKQEKERFILLHQKYNKAIEIKSLKEGLQKDQSQMALSPSRHESILNAYILTLNPDKKIIKKDNIIHLKENKNNTMRKNEKIYLQDYRRKYKILKKSIQICNERKNKNEKNIIIQEIQQVKTIIKQIHKSSLQKKLYEELQNLEESLII
jgi:hypothetical protein